MCGDNCMKMMFFKQRRINKLKIKVAKFKALSEAIKPFIEGDTTSYVVGLYLDYLAKLAEAEAELSIKSAIT
jgi:hypothetical protein